jgi:SAM-dependent methyltransferase
MRPSRPLSARLRHTGVPAVPMNDLRLAARRRVAEKIATHAYPLEPVRCPSCDADDATMVAHQDRHGLPMDVAVCGQCGFVYTNPRLSSRVLTEFYDDDAHQLDRGEAPFEELFRIGYTKGRVIEAFLASAGRQVPDGHLIAEVGAGSGGTLAYFRDRGFPTLGCDLSRGAVEYGRAHGLALHCADQHDLVELVRQKAFPVGLLILEQVLEHAVEPRKLLRDVRRMMDDQTILFIGVPGLRDIDSHYDSDFQNYLEIDHFSHFELSSLSAMLAQCSLRIVAADETIRAACVLSEENSPVTSPATKAGDILAFLRGLERRRRMKTAWRRLSTWLAF